MNNTDKQIIRELAKRHAELAANEVNAQRIARARNINSLTPERPIVWLDEIPWHEMDIDGELQLHCEDAFARRMEEHFRRVQFRWKHFQADMVVEDAYYVAKHFEATDIGVRIHESTLSLDNKNNIVSHHYEDQLDTEDKVDALRLPVITARPELDRADLALAQELVGDALPVKLRGHGIYYAPWDDIAMLRGVEPILIDMIDRPEFLHRTIEKFTQIGLSRYEQMEAQGLLDYNVNSLHCTPPYVKGLPAADFDGEHVRLKDVWFRGMAQMFTTISPAMHEEFDLQYMRRLMDRCGLSYYGCCEPLDKMIGRLKKIPNMRKIGVSPWADVRSSAEQMGGDYVYARKPNPAFVADDFDAEVVRREIRETAEACIANHCPYEFVLKDISTVSYRPGNLIQWTKTVMETLDDYYR